MEKAEFEESKPFIIVEIIEYVPNSIVIKTIIKKTSGNVTVASFDSGESLARTVSPCDTFIQIIEGEAEIIVNGVPHKLSTGQSLTIPADSTSTIHAAKRFKMISTIIKSAYDDVC
jgi:quercetin dioxygenase-like cupin family protein